MDSAASLEFKFFSYLPITYPLCNFHLPTPQNDLPAFGLAQITLVSGIRIKQKAGVSIVWQIDTTQNYIAKVLAQVQDQLLRRPRHRCIAAPIEPTLNIALAVLIIQRHIVRDDITAEFIYRKWAPDSVTWKFDSVKCGLIGSIAQAQLC